MKQSYGIPYTLDSSILDSEITIQTDNGIGARPISIKVLLFCAGAFLSGVWLLMKTFIARGTIVQKGLFLIAWLLLCALLLTASRTKQLGIERVVSALSFMQPGNRSTNTRSLAQASDFARIVGFENVADNGVIPYIDGSYGMLFDVIGNGSVLLFDSHRAAVIDRTDTHYRKMRPGTTYHFVTVKEPQQVVLQIRALDEKRNNLTCGDADLDAMIETNRYVLSDIIGSSFKSLHQYLLLQAPNEEELNLALNVLVGEAESSTLMFKHVEQLDRKGIIRFCNGIYGKRKGFN